MKRCYFIFLLQTPDKPKFPANAFKIGSTRFSNSDFHKTASYMSYINVSSEHFFWSWNRFLNDWFCSCRQELESPRTPQVAFNNIYHNIQNHLFPFFQTCLGSIWSLSRDSTFGKDFYVETHCFFRLQTRLLKKMKKVLPILINSVF